MVEIKEEKDFSKEYIVVNTMSFIAVCIPIDILNSHRDAAILLAYAMCHWLSEHFLITGWRR